jgi:hypothetical protein
MDVWTDEGTVRTPGYQRPLRNAKVTPNQLQRTISAAECQGSGRGWWKICVALLLSRMPRLFAEVEQPKLRAKGAEALPSHGKQPSA